MIMSITSYFLGEYGPNGRNLPVNNPKVSKHHVGPAPIWLLFKMTDSDDVPVKSSISLCKLLVTTVRLRAALSFHSQQFTYHFH